LTRLPPVADYPGRGSSILSSGEQSRAAVDYSTPWRGSRTGFASTTHHKEEIMEDGLKVWTTVGSAGALNQTDLAKVSLLGSVIQLGIDLVVEAPATQVVGDQVSSEADPAARVFPTDQAVVRYNVTPVDNLFAITDTATQFLYQLEIRLRGQVTAKLMEVDIETGAEKQLIFLGTQSPVDPKFHRQFAATTDPFPLLDFINKAYYVEATLVTSALVVGNPAAISIIKLTQNPSFHG
jgi:hypothetical protein